MSVEEIEQAISETFTNWGKMNEAVVQSGTGDPVKSDSTPVQRLERQGFPVPGELRKTYV